MALRNGGTSRIKTRTTETTLSPWRFDQWRFEKSTPVLHHGVKWLHNASIGAMINNGASKQRLFTMALGPKNNDALGFHHGVRDLFSKQVCFRASSGIMKQVRFRRSTYEACDRFDTLRWSARNPLLHPSTITAQYEHNRHEARGRTYDGTSRAIICESKGKPIGTLPVH